MDYASSPKLVSISGFSSSSGPESHWEHGSGSGAEHADKAAECSGTIKLQEHVRR